jgi:hypothetical protein
VDLAYFGNFSHTNSHTSTHKQLQWSAEEHQSDEENVRHHCFLLGLYEGRLNSCSFLKALFKLSENFIALCTSQLFLTKLDKHAL